MEDLRIPPPDEIGDIVRMRFEEFLKNYSIPHEGEEITQQKFLDDYMVQISNMVRFNKSTVYVNFRHLQEADVELADALLQEYYRFEPYLRHAVHNIVSIDNQHYVYDVDRGQREFFVAFYNLPKIERIRAVRTDKIGAIISICGTVTRTSEVRPELFYGSFLCRKCGTTHNGVEQQFQYTEPPVCKDTNCQHAGSFQLILNKSTFIDWQRLRVQENADEIPAGSMPRSLDIICRNECVELAKAGDKVLLTGTVVVVPDTSGLSRAGETAVASKSGGRQDSSYENGVSGLKKLGVKEMSYKMVFVANMIQVTDQRQVSSNNGPTDNSSGTNTNNNNTNTSAYGNNILPYFHEMVAPTDEENANNAHMNPLGDGTQVTTVASTAPEDAPPNFSEADYRMIEEMYKTPQLYTHMAESVCPTVYGHMEIKRGILLMLLGGVHKKTMEGISLRGDINVCVVGDPSCAKSQFLKYVHTFVPRTVYTAGKSSSAAGLTASVVRDAETGEFCVEAGALMLADNGICCIDEFDKMDATDQVAIHEAMEQQTISITKAGIQATLNARTSILAAANPVFGRYDRTKTLKANIAISAAIMSRFDLFFIIVDECNPKIDTLIAQQIVKNHAYQGQANVQHNAPFSRAQLQKYIAFARTIHPMFTTASRNTLVECYRLLRSNDMVGKNKTAYRITVRQLESLVRLSEALARLHLDPEVKEIYVREAYRLLQRSIIFVEAEDVELETEDNEDEDQQNNEPTDEELLRAIEEAEAQHAIGQQPTEYMADLDEANRLVERVTATNTDANQTNAEKKTLPASHTASLKAQHTKTHISAKEYEEISQLLLFHLKQCEEAHNMREEETLPFPGVQWQAMISWYLQQFETALVPTTNQEGEEEQQQVEESKESKDKKEEKEYQYQVRRKVISQIIRRLVKHDGSIVVLENLNTSSSGEKVANEEKFLKLHPSMVI